MSKEPVTLKQTLNPKNRGNFVELRDIDAQNLTPREQILMRVINDLEENFDNKSDS